VERVGVGRGRGCEGVDPPFQPGLGEIILAVARRLAGRTKKIEKGQEEEGEERRLTP